MTIKLPKLKLTKMKTAKIEKERSRNGPAARYEDGLLSVDCRACPGTSSLGDAGCVRCVSDCIGKHGTPSRLMIRKESDTEHSEDIITILNEISKIGSLVRAAGDEKVSGGCRNCHASLPKNAKDIWDSFPEPRFDIMRLEAERSSPEREGCEECLWRTIGFIDRLETMFSDVRKNAAKAAFRLTEV